MHHDLRVCLVGERIASAQENAPSLADHLRTRRDLQRVGDDICAVVDEDELAARELIEHGLQSLRVVRLAIALRAVVPDTYDLVQREVLVLRMRSAEDAAGAIKEVVMLVWHGDVPLRKGTGLGGSGIDVALAPRLDLHGTCGSHKDVCTSHNGDGLGDVFEVNVVKDERSMETAIGRNRGADEDGRIGDISVNERNRTSRLC